MFAAFLILRISCLVLGYRPRVDFRVALICSAVEARKLEHDHPLNEKPSKEGRTIASAAWFSVSTFSASARLQRLEPQPSLI